MAIRSLVEIGLIHASNGRVHDDKTLLGSTVLYLNVSVEDLQAAFHSSVLVVGGPVLKLSERIRKAVLEPLTVLTIQSFYTNSVLL